MTLMMLMANVRRKIGHRMFQEKHISALDVPDDNCAL